MAIFMNLQKIDFFLPEVVRGLNRKKKEKISMGRYKLISIILRSKSLEKKLIW